MAVHERRSVLLTATIVAVSLLVFLSLDRGGESKDASESDNTSEDRRRVESELVSYSGKAKTAEVPLGTPSAAPSVPVKPEPTNTAVFGAQRDESTLDYVSLLEGDDTPPWPPGTEDRIYQAIAQNSADIEITGIHSVECAGNLCTILLSIPDLNPTDSTEYDDIFFILRNSDLEIGGSSISFVDYSPGVRLIRLAIDNVEWRDERLQQVREAAAKKDKMPDRN